MAPSLGTSKQKLRDINNKLRAYLIDKNEAYYYFFKMSHGFNLIVDKEGTIADVNFRVIQELDYAQEELVGENILKFIHKDYIDKTLIELNSDRRFEDDFSFTHVYVGKHGNNVKVLWKQGYQDHRGNAYAFGEVLGDDTRYWK